MCSEAVVVMLVWSRVVLSLACGRQKVLAVK
jgi:hypothetical protein